MKKRKKDKVKKGNTMSYRTPADMHGDGVYFNEELLARKREKEIQNKQTNKD